MIFSCLVDADFLDTEQFCSPHKARYRPDQSSKLQLADLWEIFDCHMQKIIRGAVPSRVNELRREIFRQCVSQAVMPQGIFSLTVPTGGGKTLSSMAFALNHAVEHGLRRIIYAIPFTSIIEQNARVFKEIFGPEVILEHHSNLIEDDPDEHDLHLSHRLAAENWDLPIVVTTNVQFFESLFASKTLRCRKLHNIAGSVIILDEAQAIPTEYLKPCLASLRELVSRYRCSVVLCTATQPALDDTSSLRRNALPDIREIIEDTERYSRQFQRVEIEFIGRQTDAELATLLSKEKQVLCIVSTKPQAQSVFELLDDKEAAFHLSTNMYPLHRQRVLQRIRKRLQQGQVCRVVSTSLVEAGVDLDFPVVFRAMAGLDSIAQAAGRCNREGRLNDQGKLGRVLVFESEKEPSMPWLKRCVSRAREALRALPDKEPLGREMIRRYFELLYDVQELDGKNIMKLLNPAPLDKDLCFPFQEAAQLFKFIEEDTVDLIIAREPECDELIRVLRHGEYSRTTLRKLQPFTVSVRKKDLEIMHKAGGVEMIDKDNKEFPLLCNQNSYDKQVGLCVDRAGVWDADDLIT